MYLSLLDLIEEHIENLELSHPSQHNADPATFYQMNNEFIAILNDLREHLTNNN